MTISLSRSAPAPVSAPGAPAPQQSAVPAPAPVSSSGLSPAYVENVIASPVVEEELHALLEKAERANFQKTKEAITVQAMVRGKIARKRAIEKKFLQEVKSGGNIESGEKFLNDGVNINAKDDKGFTALHWAAQNGNIELAHLLVELRANVNARNNVGITPLHIAVSKGHTELAAFLLESRADVNPKANYGKTPL